MDRVEDFAPLSSAEERLLEHYSSGSRVEFGEGSVPTEALPDVSIRANFLRLLLLDSDPDLRIHEKGLRLRGAYILGHLDLQGCECRHDLALGRCYVEKPITLVNARMRGVYLTGTVCTGLHADNAHFTGSVYLRDGFQSDGELSMPGLRIDGDLQICDARLDGKGRSAVFAPSATISGSVYLGDYPYDSEESELHANGPLIFTSARIDQDFYVRRAGLSAGELGSGVTLNQDGSEGDNAVALSLARARVNGVYFAKDNQISGGIVNLSGATLKRLNDEPDGDYAQFPIRLDGLVYEDFAQHTDWSVKARLNWLDRRPDGIDFSAQPYQQLARTYLALGHREDAERVLMRKEHLQRRENRMLARAIPSQRWRVPLMWLGDKILSGLVGYGYRPVYALIWAVILIAAVSVFFQKTWNSGDMAPNAAPILVSKDWVAATKSHSDNPAAFWSRPGQAGQDYETFSPIAYATDLLIPIINLGQDDAWAPSTSRSPLGRIGWWLRWIIKGIGWVITALGAAAVTGFIRRD